MLVRNLTPLLLKPQSFKGNKTVQTPQEQSGKVSYNNAKAVSYDVARAYFMPAKKNVSFKAIILKDVAVGVDGNKLMKRLEKFIATGEGLSEIGHGLCSVVYKFQDADMPYVAKVLKKSLGDPKYKEEAKALKSVPAAMQNTQKFIARAVDNVSGKYYLITNHLEGVTASSNKVQWTRSHFDSFLEGLANLDKAGVYHNDLSPGNVLLTSNGKANIIDYQWAMQVPKTQFFHASASKEKCLFPDFMMPANVQMYEMAGLPKTLSKSTNPSKTFTDYLTTKADYHFQISEFIKKMKTKGYSVPEKTLRYEEALANVFRHISLDVKKLEANKVQFLYYNRKGFGCIDPNVDYRNVLGALPAYENAVKASKKYLDTIETLKSKPQSTDMQNYLEFSKEYGEYWHNNLDRWFYGHGYDQGIKRWLENETGTSSKMGRKIEKNKHKPIKPFIDIEKLVSAEEEVAPAQIKSPKSKISDSKQAVIKKRNTQEEVARTRQIIREQVERKERNTEEEVAVNNKKTFSENSIVKVLKDFFTCNYGKKRKSKTS